MKNFHLPFRSGKYLTKNNYIFYLMKNSAFRHNNLKASILAFVVLFGILSAAGENPEIPSNGDIDAYPLQQDSIKGQTGTIYFADAHCNLSVPEGMIFMNKEDTKKLLVNYWGNPSESTNEVFGSFVKKDCGIFNNVETAYIISYNNAGYVSDEDAESINFDSLMRDMRNQTNIENEVNKDGIKWEILGWAWQPMYDSKNKVLSWAKHLRVNNQDVINYDVRILGKAGFVVITAVADPLKKDELIAANNRIVNSVSYEKGYRYEDFNPKSDHVAEWTIGGLVAGKVLAKAGVWAALGKFSKLIIFAIIGFFVIIWKKIKRFFGAGNDGGNAGYLEE